MREQRFIVTLNLAKKVDPKDIVKALGNLIEIGRREDFEGCEALQPRRVKLAGVRATEAATPAMIEAARELYAEGSDNDIEVDRDANISCGGDGIWVQGWLFLYNEECKRRGIDNPEAVYDEDEEATA